MEKGPPLEKPARPRKVSKKSELVSGGQCARSPLAATVLNSAAQSVSEASPPKKRSFPPQVAGVFMEFKIVFACRFVAPVVQAKATSQQSFS